MFKYNILVKYNNIITNKKNSIYKYLKTCFFKAKKTLSYSVTHHSTCPVKDINICNNF